MTKTILEALHKACLDIPLFVRALIQLNTDESDRLASSLARQCKGEIEDAYWDERSRRDGRRAWD